jgi:hypothetical protein
MKYRFRMLFLLLAASCTTVQPLAGPLRTWMPWTPKWGSYIFGTIMLGTAIAAGVLKPKKKKACDDCDRMKNLLYMVSEYNDPWAEKQYGDQYEHRHVRSKKFTRWYWSMTIVAIICGVYTGVELFNRWYWQASRFWRKRIGRGYQVGDPAIKKYLQCMGILHRSTSYSYRDRGGLQFRSRSVWSLPRIQTRITTPADLRERDVRMVLALVGWSSRGFEEWEPEGSFSARVQGYLESLYQRGSSSLVNFAYVENQLQRRMVYAIPGHERGVVRNASGRILTASL